MGKLFITALCAAAAITLAAPANAQGERITYTVASNAPLLSVNYFNALDEMTTESNTGSQWEKTFTGQSTYQMVSIGAQTTGTQVACQVAINGQTRDSKTATGKYSMVVCTASV
jgi:hypothetical protein